jgi:methylenetetrahydrofolate--tRNA-(uracil-5-)-methyltransferase
VDFPQETAVGALAGISAIQSVTVFQPMNVNFGIMTPLDHRVGQAEQERGDLPAGPGHHVMKAL